MTTTPPEDHHEDDDTGIDLTKADPEEAAEADKKGKGKGHKPKRLPSLKKTSDKPAKPKAPVQQATDEDNFRSNLFLHSRKKQKDPVTLKKAIRAFRRGLVYLAPWAAALLIPLAGGTPPAGTGYTKHLVDFYSTHLTAPLIVLIPTLMTAGYIARNHNRTHPQAQKGKPRPTPQPPWPKASQRNKDIADIVANLDHIIMRTAYLVLFAASVATPAMFPVSVDDLSATTLENMDPIRTLGMGALGPIALYGTIHLRTVAINKARQDVIGMLYAVARDTLKYPKLSATMMRNGTPRQKMLLTPWLAIDVKRWASLEDADVFFVAAPDELSVDDVKTWDQFDINLNAKAPRDEEWRVQRDRRGRGATVGPANYPTSILWDGEVDPDPLTFVLGNNLETGEKQYLTFGEVSPHLAISGGTSSGKTSAAEVISAQVLIKPMPWDPNLYGQVFIIDPKGPFAQRWRGRPGVVVADGYADHHEPDADGNVITGPVVMSQAMDYLEAEHQRRASVLSQYPDAGTWVHLPDDVKRRERFAPLFIIMDEYIDHTDIEKGEDERIEKENAARINTTRLAAWQARKVRNVGMHIILIAQRVNMSIIGSTLMTNLPARIITGQMDDSQMRTMFQTDDIPNLPSTRIVYENGERKSKTIPGRARIMNALGQSIDKVQIMWFGGSTNSQTLDKWLPRGEIPPNGDFSLPAGRPRRPEDFDEEGNLLNPDAPAPTRENVDAQVIPGEALDRPTPDRNEGPDGPAPEMDPPLSEVPSDDAPPIFTGTPSGDDIFPASSREAPRCPVESCVNDVDGTCTTCGAPRCSYHLLPNPDPTRNGHLCEDDHTSHPVTEAGLGDVFPEVYERATEAGLTLRHKVEPGLDVDSGAVVTITVRNPERKIVAKITGQNGAAQIKTKSGTYQGEEAVLSRFDMAVQAHLKAQQAAQAQTEEEQ